MYAEKQLRDEGYEFVGYTSDIPVFRKIVKKHGKWAAIVNEKPIKISYEQARGLEPITREQAMRMKLGKLLLPQR